MSVNYSQAAITARLQGVINTIGNGGFLKLNHGPTPLSSIMLASPCGIASAGVLTFTGGEVDPSASGTGSVDNATITDSIGNPHISGLTVGIPGSPANVIINNGSNTTFIAAGKAVSFVAGAIIGS